MLNRLPEFLYNFSPTPLDPDFLLVRNIWRRAEILVEFKAQVTIFTEITVGEASDVKSAAKLLITKAWREEKDASSLDYPEFISQTGLLDMDDVEDIVNDIWSNNNE